MLYLHYPPSVQCRQFPRWGPLVAGNRCHATTHPRTHVGGRRYRCPLTHAVQTDQDEDPALKNTSGGWGDRIRACSTLHTLLDLIQQHSPEFSLSNACTAFAQLSRVRVCPPHQRRHHQQATTLGVRSHVRRPAWRGVRAAFCARPRAACCSRADPMGATHGCQRLVCTRQPWAWTSDNPPGGM